MTGKMFVHEMKQSWRLPVLMCVAAIVLTLIAKLVTRYMETSDYRYEAPAIISAVLFMFLMLYSAYMIVTNFIVFLMIPVRFYRECYSNIGYLTHCLPVRKSAIIWAHLFSGLIWLLLYMVLDFFCVDFLFFNEGSLVMEVFRFVFGPMLREIRNIVAEVGTPAVIVMVLIVLMVPVAPCHMILNSFCAVSLGQVFKKHRIVGAVVMYYIIRFVVGMINTPVYVILLFTTDLLDRNDTPERMTWFCVVLLAVNLLLMLVESVAFFLITKDRMAKRLNLE